jgi:hypothetical protein
MNNANAPAMPITVESYSIETVRPDKRPAIWGMAGNRLYPLCYLRKPKWMTEAQFEAIVKSIKIDATSDILQALEFEQ